MNGAALGPGAGLARCCPMRNRRSAAACGTRQRLLDSHGARAEDCVHLPSRCRERRVRLTVRPPTSARRMNATRSHDPETRPPASGKVGSDLGQEPTALLRSHRMHKERPRAAVVAVVVASTSRRRRANRIDLPDVGLHQHRRACWLAVAHRHRPQPEAPRPVRHEQHAAAICCHNGADARAGRRREAVRPGSVGPEHVHVAIRIALGRAHRVGDPAAVRREADLVEQRAPCLSDLPGFEGVQCSILSGLDGHPGDLGAAIRDRAVERHQQEPCVWRPAHDVEPAGLVIAPEDLWRGALPTFVETIQAVRRPARAILREPRVGDLWHVWRERRALREVLQSATRREAAHRTAILARREVPDEQVAGVPVGAREEATVGRDDVGCRVVARHHARDRQARRRPRTRCCRRPAERALPRRRRSDPRTPRRRAPRFSAPAHLRAAGTPRPSAAAPSRRRGDWSCRRSRRWPRTA